MNTQLAKILFTIAVFLSSLLCNAKEFQSRYLDAVDLNESGLATVVIARVGDEISDRAIKVTLDHVVRDLSVSESVTVSIPPGLHTISVDSKSPFVKATETELIVDKDSVSIVSILFTHPSFSHVPELQLRRISTATGQIVNKNFTSITQDPIFLQSTNKEFAEKVFSELLRTATEEVEKHKLQSEKLTSNTRIAISGRHIDILFTKSSGDCKLNVFSKQIESADFKDFYAAGEIVHRYDCKKFVVDLTSPGGNGESGILIGLYINLSGWTTTTGGMMNSEYQTCSSACLLAYLGGHQKLRGMIPSTLHQPAAPDGKCMNEASVSGEIFYRYLTTVMPKVGEKVFREFMLVPCDRELELSTNVFSLIAAIPQKNQYSREGFSRYVRERFGPGR